ncbi:TNF receptor-associated factor 3-like [Ruditapes philippinarum]|uniref:TNF receptor-associated factor 3-like n=1 Tax=Ruditapes philippinarum TaxID=129788 RepID=UPI00295AC542|nr:TNF receptor-associated factor 3-like [Ruditapes philippinarum]
MCSDYSSIQSTPSGTPHFIRLEPRHCCHVCKNVLRDSMQTACGHRICKLCVGPLFDDKTEPIPCPAGEEDCSDLFKSDITQDPSSRREIRDLLVSCDFVSFGCIDEIKWKALSNHVQTCKYQPVTCPNSGCNKRIPPKEKNIHLKKYCEYKPEQCTFCKKFVPSKLMQSHIEDECTSVVMPCPYQCGSPKMTRVELNNHKEICHMKPRECQYKCVGCTFMGTEEEVKNHLTSDLNGHIKLTTDYAKRVGDQTVQCSRELQVVQSERDQLRAQVNNMNQEMTLMKNNFEKTMNLCKELKLKMVSVTERVIHLEKQLENTAKKDIVERHDRDVRTMQTSLTQIRAQVVQLERLYLNEGRSGSGEISSAPELKRRIDKHDSQFAQLDVQMAELDLRFQILETASYDGTLMWKLRDYARRKQDAVQGRTLSLYSQPFYTHRYGYKMCARVYLNGDGMGKGSHMSLFFVVMRGEYDNLLPWPFQQKVTMTLLDQETGQCNLSDSFRPDPTSSRKPTTDMNIASGCPLFVSHTVLETAKYVRDDTIVIMFQVDMLNVYHP